MGRAVLGKMGRVEGPRAGRGNEWLGASLRCRSVAGERPFAQEGGSRASRARRASRAELSSRLRALSPTEKRRAAVDLCGCNVLQSRPQFHSIRATATALDGVMCARLFRCCEPVLFGLSD